MGFSQDYSHVPDWVEKPEGYQAGAMVKYQGNVFIANFWASKPGEGDANENGWRLHDELYDVTSTPATAPARIIGYIPTWRKKEGFDYANAQMYRSITHGIISFLMFSETDLGQFEPTSVNDIDAILSDVVATGHDCGTYISIALGGATDYGFFHLMERIGNNPADPVLQKAVNNVVDFVESNGLDGVDLDLECWWDENNDPNKDQGGRLKSDGPHPAGKGLTEFAKQLKQAMPDKIISAALFATSWYGNCYDPGLVEYLDWLGIMTYDLTGSWNQTPVGPQTALLKIRQQQAYADEQQGEWPANRKSSANTTDPMSDNPILSVEDSLWYWTNPFFTNWQGTGQNLPRNKIATGVPIYGYDFAYGKQPDDLSGQIAPGYKTIRYKDLLGQFPDADTAMDLTASDRDQVIDLLRRIRNRQIRHNPNATRPDGFDNLAQAYQWLPGNLFIGPRGGNGDYQRDDDPGDDFEVNADVIVGSNFGARQQANQYIQQYLESRNPSNARQAIENLSRIAQRNSPFDLDSNNWIYSHRKYHIRLNRTEL